jgi:hypothetical protein
VATLHRALALAEERDATGVVGEDLRLDVTRALDVALDEHAAIAERGLRLAAREIPRGVEFRVAAHDAHALAAATGRGLEHERVADTLARTP